jgi:Kef-type K+ transport system membrane component KefB
MHVPTLVAALAIVVVASAIFGYIAQRMGLVAIVGYIVAGIVVGPYALGFIADDFELVEAMGEIGVIFLMFFIGLELGGDLLKKLGALLFGGGAIQVTLTIALVAAIAAIFFASIGMRLNPSALLETWPLVLLFSAVVVIVKFIGVGTAAAVFKRPLPVVVSSGLFLAQIGEFSFILENIGRQSGLSPLELGETGSQVFIAVTMLLIALTPLLFSLGNLMQKRLEVQQTA